MTKADIRNMALDRLAEVQAMISHYQAAVEESDADTLRGRQLVARLEREAADLRRLHL